MRSTDGGVWMGMEIWEKGEGKVESDCFDEGCDNVMEQLLRVSY